MAGSYAYSQAIALGDLNGDDVLDIVTAGYLTFSATGGGGVRLGAATCDDVLTRLVSQRGTIGVFQSRIGTAVSALQIGSENIATAASRITDADIAEESAKVVSGKILQQAATAILRQANSRPQIALKLIGNRNIVL